MSKFFIPRANVFDNKLIIGGEDVKHITRVLRYGIGDEIICCDGAGNDYSTRIVSCGDKIECEIIKKKHAETEADINVTLIQGVPKASKMDYIIQKTTELGICDIYPCRMSRCVAKIDNDKKTDRWQKISREAAKQSGRGIIPEVHTQVDIDGAIEILKKADIAFAAYECEETQALRPILTGRENPSSVAFIIGPEGGFDHDEIEKITQNGIPTVSLGRRILRTETAGEAVLSMIMYEIGDING